VVLVFATGGGSSKPFVKLLAVLSIERANLGIRSLPKSNAIIAIPRRNPGR
jgi:hypothetical protein